MLNGWRSSSARRSARRRRRSVLATLLGAAVIASGLAVLPADLAHAVERDWPGNGWINPSGDPTYQDYGFATCDPEYNEDNAANEEDKAHLGADSQGVAPAGSPVVAMATGTVVRVKPSNWGPGGAVGILHDHSSGQFVGIYGHINVAPGIAVGTIVAAGQPIGALYDWGDNTHLHLGVRPLAPGENPSSVGTPGNDACANGIQTMGTVDPIPWLAAHAPATTRDAYAGHWTGTISTPTGSTFSAVVNLRVEGGLLVGTIDHPDVPCYGTTVEVGTDEVGVLLDTTYTAESNCIAGGQHRLSVLDASTLQYEWFEPGTDRVDRGLLTRVEADTGSGPITPPTVVVTPLAPARSEFSADYYADVTSVTKSGAFTIDVAFEAVGQADLRRPEDTCLVHPDGYRANPLSTTLSTDAAGHFVGIQRFAVIVPGTWSLRYSCAADYSDAPVAEVGFDFIAVSYYSDDYYAVVLADGVSASGRRALLFVAQGYTVELNELRDPATSCLSGPSDELFPLGSDYAEAVPGHYYYGTLEFPADPSYSTFTYSCQSDYTTIELP